ncbi:MAG: glycosyltransferase family 39 protein [Bryobacteraceae bacterium]|nr:glycosyltransferase family 39 protein [Bryobacteraceae bacterium]
MSPAGPGRHLAPVLCLVFLLSLLAFVLFHQIGSSGLLGPDEPRYASIGRAMSESGDWVTPQLNGKPWYEKPPLLYWLIALGFAAGLDNDAAPRVPIGLLSIIALILWTRAIAQIENLRVAAISAAILASTAGWSALSMIGVTDLPMAACFSAALAFGAAAAELDNRTALVLSGIWLGLAILAKGLVPLVLLLPFVFWARRHWRMLLCLLGIAVAVAAPWYLLMTARHGWAFIDVFFLQHHFGRFSSEALQHVRPFWFYIPVLLAGFFPWTPLLLLLERGPLLEPRNRVWVWTALFGLVFFSASTNKLPAYLLPLFPAICLILARALDQARAMGRTLAVCLFLLSLVPAIASLLPDALLHGLSRTRLSEVHWEYFVAAAPAAVVVYLLDRFNLRLAAVTMLSACSIAALLYVKLSAAPVLGEVVSARGLARRAANNAAQTCVGQLHRNYRYGLDYYLKRELPACEAAPSAVFLITQEPGRLPRIVPR